MRTFVKKDYSTLFDSVYDQILNTEKYVIDKTKTKTQLTKRASQLSAQIDTLQFLKDNDLKDLW